MKAVTFGPPLSLSPLERGLGCFVTFFAPSFLRMFLPRRATKAKAGDGGSVTKAILVTAANWLF